MSEPETEAGGQQKPVAAGKVSAFVARSAPVQVTLLALYALPLLLLLIAAVTSGGFLEGGSFLALALQVNSQYFENLRESFATFVVPFLTAYAASGSQSAQEAGLGSTKLFFILAVLLLVSIALLGLLNLRADQFTQNFELEPDAVKTLYDNAKALLTAYTKELLVYISLLLGVGARKAV